MKCYDSAMEHLRFREDFCEDTLRKVQQNTKKYRKLPRGLLAAAYICLCTVVLFGTALAVSSEFRSIFISNERIDTVEQVSLPEDAETIIENHMDTLTARYYKLDGEVNAAEGFGSIIPVEKDGKTTYYCLSEDGSLKEAVPTRTIEKVLEYEGHTFELNMTIYSGDKATMVMGDRSVPMVNEDTYTLWYEKQPDVLSPLFVDLTTWEIYDPMKNIVFVQPEDALYTDVSASRIGTNVLLVCELAEGAARIYCGNAETGELINLADPDGGQWFMQDGSIYSYSSGVLCKMNEEYQMVPVFGEERCYYKGAGNYVSVQNPESDSLTLVNIVSGERLILENCADLFSGSVSVSENPSGTRLAVMNFKLSGGLNTSSIAVINPEKGEMVSLERKPGMTEEMCGWLDNDHILIAGTVGDEWYLCIYEIG